MAESFDVLPRSLHQQHIVCMKLYIRNIIFQVFILALDPQHIHVILIAEIRITDRLIYKIRRRHQDNLSNTNVIEGKCIGCRVGQLAFFLIVNLQLIIFGKLMDILVLTRQEQDVSVLQYGISVHEFLLDILEKVVLRHISPAHFQDIQVIFVTHIQFDDRFPLDGRERTYLQPREVAQQPIFLHQFVQRLLHLLVRFILVFRFREEQFAEYQQDDRTHNHTDQAYGKECQEFQVLSSSGTERLLNDQVRRCTDQRHHTA